MKIVDLRNQRNIAARDILFAGVSGAAEVVVSTHAEFKSDARDLLEKYGIAVRFFRNDKKSSEFQSLEYSAFNPEIDDLSHSSAIHAIKEEICAVGRKLWLRSLVDGNGGNVSCRLDENMVLCTPTLCSKFDLTPDDLCLMDLEGTQVAGKLPPTSEVYLHLEVYKSAPKARAVVHCHPPHATAYAITGRVPPIAISSEFDVFIGRVALAEYETPGTVEFSKTIRPYVEKHNTILLANHGVLCWADTPTHAEWYAENLEAYCYTLLIAHQLGAQFSRIPPSKEKDLLAIRKRLGLPDLSEPVGPADWLPSSGNGLDIDALAEAVTEKVLAALKSV